VAKSVQSSSNVSSKKTADVHLSSVCVLTRSWNQCSKQLQKQVKSF